MLGINSCAWHLFGTRRGFKPSSLHQEMKNTLSGCLTFLGGPDGI
jgi:hypothetical protein